MEAVKTSFATLRLEPPKTKRILRSGAGRLGFEVVAISVQGRTKKIPKRDAKKANFTETKSPKTKKGKV